MRSKPMSVPDGILFNGHRPRVTPARCGMRATDHFDGHPDIGRDAYRLHENAVGMGSIVVSLVWLAFYVVATVHPLISGPAPQTSTVKPPVSIALPSSR